MKEFRRGCKTIVFHPIDDLLSTQEASFPVGLEVDKQGQAVTPLFLAEPEATCYTL